MTDGIQTAINTAASGADRLITDSVLGALVVIELFVILLLGFLLWKTRDKYTDHLEEHYDSQI